MILGIDTSTTRLSIALREGKAIPECEHFLSQQRHNETMLPQLEKMLAKKKKQPKEITGIAVGLGPGSFTGVRVGIATAMGLAQSLQLPVIGISSFLTIAAGVDAQHVLVIGDARQGFLYAAAFEKATDRWQVILEEKLVEPDELVKLLPEQKFTLAGPDAKQFYPQLSQRIHGLVLASAEKQMPDAGVLIQLADQSILGPLAKSFDQGGTPLELLLPIYLRRTQAEEMREKSRLG